MMPRDDEVKKLRLWAATGDRSDPEDEGIDRDEGWDLRYEQLGSGALVEREVWNQLLRELSGQAVEVQRDGVMRWVDDQDYVMHAFAVGSDGLLHVATRPSGPSSGGAEDPTSGGSAWRIY